MLLNYVILVMKQKYKILLIDDEIDICDLLKSEYTATQLKMFKKGERNNDANSVMRSIASLMTEEQIEAVSQYIQGLRQQ